MPNSQRKPFNLLGFGFDLTFELCHLTLPVGFYKTISESYAPETC